MSILKPIDENTEVVSVDDQISHLQSFHLAAKLLRMPASSYALYQMSEDFLDKLPPEGSSLRIVYLDWNLVGNDIQKSELIKEVKKRMPDVLIYIVSTSMDKSEQAEAEVAGANGWLSKASLIKTLKKFNLEYKDKLGKFHVWD